jgi:hypothetical protein
VGEDFFLCFSPERVDPGNPVWQTRNTPKVLGGVTVACKELGLELYSRVFDTMVPVGSAEAAELTKVYENTFRMINIALANELAQACDKLGVDVWEVIEAAATKPFGFMKFTPGPGLGGHCIPLDPHYLQWKMRTLAFKTRMIELASEINGEMPAFVVRKVADCLNDVAKPVKGSRVLVLGVAYKKDVDDLRESPAMDVIRLLMQRRRDPRQQRGHERQYGTESEHPEIERERQRDGNGEGRQRREQHSGEHPREHDTSGPADRKEQQRFGRELSYEPAAAGADRDPYGNLAASRRCARQQHAGDVGARNHENQRYERGQQSDERGRDPAQRRWQWRRERDTPVDVLKRAGPVPRQRAADRLQFRGRLRASHVGLQPCAHHQLTFVRRHRNPEIRRGDAHPAEALARHAGDRERLAVQIHRTSDDAGIAGEPPLPEVMTQDDFTFADILRGEQAPHSRGHAEGAEVIGRHQSREDALRGARFAQTARLRFEVIGVDVLQRGHALAHIAVDGIRTERNAELPLHRRDDVDETSGVGDTGRGPQEQAVGDGEDRGRRADSDRQRERGRQREQRIVPQDAAAIAAVAHEGVDQRPRANVANAIFDGVDAAKLARGRAPSLLRGHPRRHSLGHREIERGANLVVEIAFDLVAMDHVPPQTR